MHNRILNQILENTKYLKIINPEVNINHGSFQGNHVSELFIHCPIGIPKSLNTKSQPLQVWVGPLAGLPVGRLEVFFQY